MNRAVYAAVQAFQPWADLGYARRAAFLVKIADLLEKRLDEFALAESRDQGKPVSLAKAMDIPRLEFNQMMLLMPLSQTGAIDQGHPESARVRRELDPRPGDVQLGGRDRSHQLHDQVSESGQRP